MRVLLAADILVLPLREGDKVVMEQALHILPPTQCASFNRACKYFRRYFMSQLVLSDGKTVDPTALTLGYNQITSYQFPREEPTPQDIMVWLATVKP